jgi:hypothetical protein
MEESNQEAKQRLSPLDQGSVDPIGSRQAGHEDKGLLSPTQDSGTELRRAHYGEDPAFILNSGETRVIFDSDVNDVKTPNNPTKQDRITPGTKLSGDGFYNHSCSG